MPAKTHSSSADEAAITYTFKVINTPEVALAKLRETMFKLYSGELILSEEIYFQTLSLNVDMQRIGSDDIKKSYCAFLYWAKMNLAKDPEEYNIFSYIEQDFIDRCSPLLDSIAFFWPPASSLRMPDAYNAEPASLAVSAPRHR